MSLGGFFFFFFSLGFFFFFFFFFLFFLIRGRKNYFSLLFGPGEGVDHATPLQ